MWCTYIGCWLFSINSIVMLDDDSLGLWDYIGMGLYNQRWPGWVVMNALCGIGLLPYVVIQLMNLSYGIGLLSYVIMQMMIIHQGWLLDRVITL